ncbi:VOC family protein [uncultured Piscinibacter sp.]|uniref:VOC family protein n=1 Tax=uncultured Piscinibacter sp. TaxID=1131835 RepID=UPI002624A5DF|nr:VOC family protein [uncultured Piscinibacter sp.]
MGRQIFVNLPVRDVARTRAFFTALGFSFNPQFSDDKALCMVIADDSFAMLLAEPFFQGFTKKPVADARNSTEVLVALSCANAAEVDAMVAKAVAAGGRVPVERKDYGFMVQHGFEDPDGHQWEVFWMDPSAESPKA